MTIDQTTFLNWFGCREVPELENSAYSVLVDDTGWGMVFHRLKHPGQVLRAVVCAVPGRATLAQILARVGDAAPPVGARCYAWDVTGWFVWTGAVWAVETPFAFAAQSASVAVPLAQQVNENAGFNGFGPGQALALGFMQPGRRFRWSSTVGRTQGNSSNGLLQTQVRVAGVPIFSAPWASAGMREQYPFFEFWVSGANQITTKALALPNQATVSQATVDVAVPNLQAAGQALIIGINNDNGVQTTEHFGISDVLIECLR